jgi:hypothetical protein
MAEPKKETVRIVLPPRPETRQDPQDGGAKDTARIVLPSQTPAIPPRRLPPTIKPPSPARVEPAAESPTASLRRLPVQAPQSSASPVLQPLPKPVAPDPTPGAMGPAAPGNFTGISPSPKKETARIAVLPKPAAVPKPRVNMTKTQPLIMRPTPVVQAAPVIVTTSSAPDPFDSIPRSLCWLLLGISALIFFIQIWNYAVS